MALSLSIAAERFPIAGSFSISRGAKTEAAVVVATICDGHQAGRGECVPYGRYGESIDSVTAAIEMMREPLADGLDRIGLQRAMPAGAARNALDCAFWDLEAKCSGRPVHDLAGLPSPKPLTTAYTISLADPHSMAQAAARAAPQATLIVDANEGWSEAHLAAHLEACARAGVALVEQPLPEDRDEALARIPHPIPVCADESAHDRASLAGLMGKYDVVNIKLDKAGGLTEALAMASAAQAAGLAIMAGCMVATSLSMAPAVLLAQSARFTDLDGPLLLTQDRAPGLRYDGSLIFPPAPALWG